jgi:hypothetical protein
VGPFRNVADVLKKWARLNSAIEIGASYWPAMKHRQVLGRVAQDGFPDKGERDLVIGNISASIYPL